MHVETASHTCRQYWNRTRVIADQSFPIVDREQSILVRHVTSVDKINYGCVTVFLRNYYIYL